MMKTLIHFLKEEEGQDFAEYALILGEQELSEKRIGLKPLRENEEQESVALDNIAATLADKLK